MMDTDEILARRILDDEIKRILARADKITRERYPDSPDPFRSILRRLAEEIVAESPLSQIRVIEGGKTDASGKREEEK